MGGRAALGGGGGALATGLSGRFGDGYMITVRTRSSQRVKDVVRFFNRNFPEAVLKVGGAHPGSQGTRPSGLSPPDLRAPRSGTTRRCSTS